MKLDWKEEFAIGIEKIDEQHKGLFELINELEETSIIDSERVRVIEAIRKLIEYAKYHFEEEEALMETVNYEGLARHKKEHEHFVDRVFDFHQDFVTGKDGLKQELLAFVTNWIRIHIAQTDRLYVPFLKKQ